MANVYEELGVEPIINAVGPATRLSGSIMRAEVAEAMRQASEWCVDIAELQARAGEIIAEVTGAEAGYVTSGAAAGLLLGTAACVTGLDPGKMHRVPDTRGMFEMRYSGPMNPIWSATTSGPSFWPRRRWTAW